MMPSAEMSSGGAIARDRTNQFYALAILLPVIETETRLLGETVNWFARRSFVGVA